MNKLKIFIMIFAFCGMGSGFTHAASKAEVQSQDIEIIDTPTADAVDHYGYHVSFRFGKLGGLQTKTSFGVFPRLNIGFGLDGEQVIGTGDARLNKPSINVKFRLFDGQGVLPALAVGFDGQGYVYNKKLGEYEQKEKGFYLVASREIFVPDLNLSLGGNIFDFDKGNSSRAFGSLNYTYRHLLGLMFEYDHATVFKERRINFGLKYFVTPVFTVDLIGRNIPKFVGSSSRETERLVRLVYNGAF